MGPILEPRRVEAHQVIVFGMFRALLICHMMFEFDVGIISVCELLVFMIGISVVL